MDDSNTKEKLMGAIKGWAFKENELELRDAAVARYDEIKHLREEMEVSSTVAYGKNTYNVLLLTKEAQTLTDYDIALIMDRGNLCFGGNAHRDGNHARVTVWTD